MDKIRLYAFADEADSSIDGQIKAMLRNNLHGLEIRGVDGQNISDISIQKAKEVKSKLDNNGLITWSIGSPIGKIKIDEDFTSHLEKFKHTLEIANTLNAKNIRLFSFYIPNGDKVYEYKNEVIDRMGNFIDLSKESGINLCHENEKGIYGDTPERCLELFENLPELKGIFDPANFVQCDVDTLYAWKLLKKYISYMHIKDSQKGGFIVPAGFGDGNLKTITKEYLEQGGREFTMEPHLAIFEGLAALEQEGEKSAVASFKYNNNDEAFDAACIAFKKMIEEI